MEPKTFSDGNFVSWMELMSTFVGCRYIWLVSWCRGYFRATSEGKHFCEKCCKSKLSIQQSQNYWLDFSNAYYSTCHLDICWSERFFKHQTHASTLSTTRFCWGWPLFFSFDDHGVCCAFTQKICSETTGSWNSGETVVYTYDLWPTTLSNCKRKQCVGCMHPSFRKWNTFFLRGSFSRQLCSFAFVSHVLYFPAPNTTVFFLLNPLKMVVNPHLWRALDPTNQFNPFVKM